MRRRAINVTNQKIPPLNKIQAECKKLRSFPNIVQEYVEDAQATIIITTRSAKPNISSSHLFILIVKVFNLKRLCLKNTYVQKIVDSFINRLFF